MWYHPLQMDFRSLKTSILVGLLISGFALPGCDGNGDSNVDAAVDSSLEIQSPQAGATYRSRIPFVATFDSGPAAVLVVDDDGKELKRLGYLGNSIDSGFNLDLFNEGQNTISVSLLDETESVIDDARISFEVDTLPGGDEVPKSLSLFALDDDIPAALGADFRLVEGNSIELLATAEYPDGLIADCTDDATVSIGDEGIAAYDEKSIRALAPGTTSIRVGCNSEVRRLTLTVLENIVTSYEAQPDRVLLRSVADEQPLTVMERLRDGTERMTSSVDFDARNPLIASTTADGRITADGLGQTSIVVRHNGGTITVPVDVVEELAANPGLVTVQHGGIIEDQLVTGNGSQSARLVLRPDSISLDTEITFEYLNPGRVNVDKKPGEQVIAAFRISPRNEQFIRQIIVELPGLLGASNAQSAEVVRVLDTAEDSRLGGLAIDNSPLSIRLDLGGTYALVAPFSSTVGPTPPASKIFLKSENATVRNSADGFAGRLTSTPKPNISWPNGWKASQSRGNIEEDLWKFRPIIKVAASAANEQLSKGGEVPLRISDLLNAANLKNAEDAALQSRVTDAEAARLLRSNDADDVRFDFRQDWHDTPGIPAIYGRVAFTPVEFAEDRTERWKVLQYWLFQPGSELPEESAVPGKNDWHEGDVEFFQVLLDEEGEPVAATAGQHYYGESRHASEVEGLRNGNRPVIYTAAGSHATYFSSEDVPSGTGRFGFLSREGNAKNAGNEDLTSATVEIEPALFQLRTSHIFFLWKGFYGERRIRAAGDGPPAPFFRGPETDVGLSMFRYPADFHFTYVIPGDAYAGLLEKLARQRHSPVDTVSTVRDKPILLRRCPKFSLLFASFPHVTYDIFRKIGRQAFRYQDAVSQCTGGNISAHFDAYHVGSSVAATKCIMADDEYPGKDFRRFVFREIKDEDVFNASYRDYGLSDVIPELSCTDLIADNDVDGLVDSSDNDDDNDGLSDSVESEQGTDPLAADSDDDGLGDQDEVAGGSSPTTPSGFVFIISDINIFSQKVNSFDNDVLFNNLMNAAVGERRDLNLVKFYEGHGGNLAEPDTEAGIRSFVESKGLQFRLTNEAPINTSGVRSLFVLYPGRRSRNDFTVAEINELRNFIASGGVLVAVAENSGYQSDKRSYNALLDQLGIEVSNDFTDLERVLVTSDVAQSPITAGVGTVAVSRPSTFTVDTGFTGNQVLIRLDDGRPIMLRSVIDLRAQRQPANRAIFRESNVRSGSVSDEADTATSFSSAK